MAKPAISTAQQDHRAEHKRFSENHYNRAQTIAAWLLATLVAVNTSGGVAIVSAAKRTDRQPALAFALGVALAVLSGLCTWGEALNYAGFHYVKSQERPTAEEEEMRDGSNMLAPRLATAALWLNGAALTAFIVGCG
jgi:hypothetical protein